MSITVHNNENFAAWVEDLATTTAPQISGSLRGQKGSEWGFCCLGRGCEIAGPETDVMWDAGAVWYYSPTVSTNALPPAEWLAWIGVSSSEYTASPFIDWPTDLRTTTCVYCGYDLAAGDGACFGGQHQGYTHSTDRHLSDAAALNDGARLTFKQIADVLRYFGVREEA